LHLLECARAGRTKKNPPLLPALRGLLLPYGNCVIRNLRRSASICTVVRFAGKHVVHEYVFPTVTTESYAIHPCPDFIGSMCIDIGLVAVDESVVVEVQLYIWVRVSINERIQLASNEAFPYVTNILERGRIVHFLAHTTRIVCGIRRISQDIRCIDTAGTGAA
jgi:hypothetical protein